MTRPEEATPTDMQVLISPIDGSKGSFIDTIGKARHQQLERAEPTGPTDSSLHIYVDSRGRKHQNVTIYSLGPVRKKEE